MCDPGLARRAKQGTMIMNANLSGVNAISELSVDELDSVSGGNDLRGAVLGYLVGKLFDEMRVVDQIKEKIVKAKT